MIAAEMPGWLGTLTALPTSCSNDANTTSSSAPARSASVAVWRQCVSWATANPSTTSSSERSLASTRSATRAWLALVSLPMTPHCSAVDSSIRVNVVAMAPRLCGDAQCRGGVEEEGPGGLVGVAGGAQLVVRDGGAELA